MSNVITLSEKWRDLFAQVACKATCKKLNKEIQKYESSIKGLDSFDSKDTITFLDGSKAILVDNDRDTVEDEVDLQAKFDEYKSEILDEYYRVIEELGFKDDIRFEIKITEEIVLGK